MCGICGFIKLTDSTVRIDRQYLEDMNNQMIHRGPDGARIWLSNDNLVGMGHRRLSIIDLSERASQPMENEDGSVVLTFNGEIYNHAEIRRELEATGHHIWRTDHSDTEVIIHAYEEWGMKCLERFRGMFAFVLWDSKKRTAYAVRDRMGIKPLYYMISGGVFTFASDINSLLKVMPRKPSVNERALYDYLSFLCTPGEDTLFSEIKKLEPARYLAIKNDGSQIKKVQYWDVLDHLRPEIYNASENEIIEELLREFRVAANLRKESDVPVGVFLSGGVDSSTNAVVFAETSKEPVETFSVGYDKKYLGCSSEFAYARKVADQIKANRHEVVMDEEKTIAFLDEMIKLQGEPLADPVCVPVYYLSKLARENGVIVCQVGEGADELFAGYGFWKTWQMVIFLSKMDVSPYPFSRLARSVVEKSGIRGGEHGLLYEVFTRKIKEMPLYWSTAESFFEENKKSLLSPHFYEKFSNYTSYEAIRPIYERFCQKRRYLNDTLSWMTYIELNLRLPELLLQRVDKMSMGVSVECRVPFLDHKVVELAMSIPARFKIRQGESKYILKKAVEPFLSRDIIYRPKQGFDLPVTAWINDRLGEKMKRNIKFFAQKTGYVDGDKILSNWNNALVVGNRRNWILYNLAAWWGKHID